MKNKNLYEILGLSPDCTKEEIKITYRKLVRIYHPDVNKTIEAENYFKLLNNAAETLLDDAKRLQYDTLVGISRIEKDYVKNEDTQDNTAEEKIDKNSGDKTPEYQSRTGFYSYKTGKDQSNSSIFNNKNHKTPDNKEFYANKNAKTQDRNTKIDGKDIETVVNITKKEQQQGTIRKINVLHTDKCPKCAGIKYINGKVCALCHGVGEKSEHKIMNVKIPPGIKSGTKMKIKNEGEYGKFGGKNGNLYLLIQIETENEKNFNDENHIIEASIPPWQAILGGKTTLCIEGKNVSISIPPLTKTNTRFKLKKDDENLLSLGLKSDYTVIIRIDIKQNFNEEEIELYKKLKEIDSGLYSKN